MKLSWGANLMANDLLVCSSLGEHGVYRVIRFNHDMVETYKITTGVVYSFPLRDIEPPWWGLVASYSDQRSHQDEAYAATRDRHRRRDRG